MEIPNYADRENRNEEYKNFFEEIAKNSNVDTWSYCFQCREYSFDIPQSKLYESKTGGVPDIMNYSIENGVLKTNLCIMAVDDSAYKEIIKSTGKTPEELKGKKVDYIFISCGSKEGPDRIRKAVDDLKAAGYNAESYISEGTAHEFLTWRRSLYQMAQKLFKK